MPIQRARDSDVRLSGSPALGLFVFDCLLLFAEAVQYFIQQRIEFFKILLWHVYALGDVFRDFHGVILQLAAFVGNCDDQAALVLFGAVAGQKALGFQFFQDRCQCSGIQVQVFSEFFDGQGFMFPEDHHGDVLGIGQVQLVQKRFITADDLLGACVERETELVPQAQAVVFGTGVNRLGKRSMGMFIGHNVTPPVAARRWVMHVLCGSVQRLMPGERRVRAGRRRMSA